MRKFLFYSLAVMLFAACSSGSLGDLGGTLGDILGSTGQSDRSDIRGVVTTVDTSARRIDLDVTTVNNLRDERRGSSVYYDDRTTVVYNNAQYRPDQLERGDEISIRGFNDNGRFYAERITVLRDVSR
jgi:hypothetical protein